MRPSPERRIEILYLDLSFRMKFHSAGIGTFPYIRGLPDFIGPCPSVALDKFENFILEFNLDNTSVPKVCQSENFLYFPMKNAYITMMSTLHE